MNKTQQWKRDIDREIDLVEKAVKEHQRDICGDPSECHFYEGFHKGFEEGRTSALADVKEKMRSLDGLNYQDRWDKLLKELEEM